MAMQKNGKSNKSEIKAPAASVSKVPAAAVSSTPVRNSPIPRPMPAAAPAPMKKQITHEVIARRAYEISQSSLCGSQEDNWLRAERELRGM